MSDKESDVKQRLLGQQQQSQTRPGTVEGPPFLAGWLRERHREDGSSSGFLEWLQPAVTSDAGPRLYQTGQIRKVQHPTIHTDNEQSASTKQVAIADLKRSVGFLEKKYFDTFMPHDVLLNMAYHDQIAASAEQSASPGNAVCAEYSILTREAEQSTHFYLTAVKTGSLGNDLSVLLSQDRLSPGKGWSSEMVTDRDNLVMSFPTAIEDIKSFSGTSGATFGIRTASSITLLNFTWEDSHTGRGNLDDYIWQRPLNLGSECFGNHQVCDFALNSYMGLGDAGRAVFVDDIGGIWHTRRQRATQNAANMPVVSRFAAVEQLRQGTIGSLPMSARIAFGTNENLVVVARGSSVRQFDLRDHHRDRTVLNLLSKDGPILDMAQPPRFHPSSPIRVLCTSSEVIWVDLSAPSNPILRYKHHFEKDRTLSLSSVFCDGICHTILWSRRSSAMTVFSHTGENPFSLLAKPYEVAPPVPGFVRSGVSLLHLQAKDNKRGYGPEAVVLVEAGSDGSVYQREFVCSTSQRLRTQRLEVRRIPARPSIDDAAVIDAKRARIAKFFLLYNRIFATHPSLQIEYESMARIRLRKLNEESSGFSVPLELVELAEPYSKQPEKSKKAQFKHESACTILHALDRASIGLESVKDALSATHVPESTPFATFGALQSGVTTQEPDSASLDEILQIQYACHRFSSTSSKGKNRSKVTAGDDEQESVVKLAHTFACEQVALDLALSSSIYTANAPQAPLSGAEDVSMSSYDALGEMPSLEYGFFNPVTKDGSVPSSAAAQALLSEWTLGADPHSRPPFINPYDHKVKEAKIANKQLKAFKTRIARGVDMSASQPNPGMPRLGKGAAAPISREDEQRKDVHKTLTASTPQPAMQEYPSRAETETQPQASIPMPYSQVLPGAHGGQPKKKKKRTGGF